MEKYLKKEYLKTRKYLKMRKYLEAELCRPYSFLKIKKIFSRNITPRISFLVRCVDEQILFNPKVTSGDKTPI